MLSFPARTARSTPGLWTRAGLVLAIGALICTAACGDPAAPATPSPSATTGTRQPVPLRSPTVTGRATAPAPPAAGFAGQLDPTFGQAGVVTTDFGSGDEAIHGVVVQPDGKIVAVGKARSRTDKLPHFTLTRYDSQGALDPGFGDGGIVSTPIRGRTYDYSGANAVALQPDGKIVAVGAANDPDVGHRTFAIARYNPDGSLDPSFSEDGTTQVPVTLKTGAGLDDEAFGVSLAPDGKILIVGVTGNYPSDFAVVRVNPDGSPDAGFGQDGVMLTDFGEADVARAVVVQPDGRILVAGTGRTGDSIVYNDFGLARYEADGTLDTSFGQGGKVLTDFGGKQSDEAFALLLQPDGKIVAGGPALDGAGPCLGGPQICELYGFGLARYTPDGRLDPRFGKGGTTVERFGFGIRTAGNYGLVRLPDGRLATAGQADDDFGLALYTPDGAVVTSIGAKGLVRTAFGQQTGRAYALALQPDGKLVAAGVGGADPNDQLNVDFALARYR